MSLLWLDCVASHSSEYLDQQIVRGTAKSVDPYTQKHGGHAFLFQSGEILRDLEPFLAFEPS